MVRRRNRRRNRRRFVRRGRGMRRAFNGGLIRGRMHPPTSSASPWNTYVMTVLWSSTKSGIQCVDLKSVQENLRTELGIHKDTGVDIRLTRIDAWTQPQEAITDRNCIVLSPSDWTGNAACTSWDQLNWYESWGTAVQPAHVHYVWPRSISNQVLPKEVDCTLFRLDCKDGKVRLILKFHMLWRPSDPDPYPKVSGILTSLRTRSRMKPPVIYSSDDEFDTVGIGDMAISPVAGGCNSVVPPLPGNEG